MNRKHLILMAIGCLLPLLALGIIFVFQIPVNGVIKYGLVLLCPAMHLLMMRDHLGHKDHQPHQDEHQPHEMS